MILTENPLASNTSFVIDNASPFTNYTIVLQANTNNGLNLPSQSVNVMTLEAGKQISSLYQKIIGGIYPILSI